MSDRRGYASQSNPDKEVADELRRRRMVASTMQRENTRQSTQNALDAMAKATHTSESSLPPGGIHHNMSEPDARVAAARMTRPHGAGVGGLSRDWMGGQGVSNPPAINNPDGRGAAPQTVTQVHVPSVQSQLGAPATGRETPGQVAAIKAGNLHGAAPLATTEVTRGGATPRQMPGFDLNSTAVQGALDSVPSTALAIAKEKASGKTPFGTAKATFVMPGTPQPTPDQTAAATNKTGVQHPDWQQQLIANHPDVGFKGTAANTIFTHAHQAAVASGKPFDPHELADKVLAPLYASGDARRPGAEPAGFSGYEETAGRGAVARNKGAGLTPEQANPILAQGGRSAIPVEPPREGGLKGLVGAAGNAISTGAGKVVDWGETAANKVKDFIVGSPQTPSPEDEAKKRLLAGGKPAFNFQ